MHFGIIFRYSKSGAGLPFARTQTTHRPLIYSPRTLSCGVQEARINICPLRTRMAPLMGPICTRSLPQTSTRAALARAPIHCLRWHLPRTDWLLRLLHRTQWNPPPTPRPHWPHRHTPPPMQNYILRAVLVHTGPIRRGTCIAHIDCTPRNLAQIVFPAVAVGRPRSRLLAPPSQRPITATARTHASADVSNSTTIGTPCPVAAASKHYRNRPAQSLTRAHLSRTARTCAGCPVQL